jgi:hypothetical protein
MFSAELMSMTFSPEGILAHFLKNSGIVASFFFRQRRESMMGIGTEVKMVSFNTLPFSYA